MRLIRNGMEIVKVFDCIEELNYNFLNAMEISTLPNGMLISPLADQPIQFGGKNIVASIDPMNIKYAGEEEIQLDLLNNFKMVVTLFGLYLDKMRVFDNRDILSYYANEVYDDNKIRHTSITIEFEDRETVTSKSYINKCLAYVELIFDLSEESVDLSNFDTTVEQYLEKSNK